VEFEELLGDDESSGESYLANGLDLRAISMAGAEFAKWGTLK